jgi:lipoyl-dependent peroxiredoxin
MPDRKAEAEYSEERSYSGSGSIKLGSGALEAPYSFKSRFEDEAGTNPEELVGAALAACFSMFFFGVLKDNGFRPQSIHTVATVHFGNRKIRSLLQSFWRRSENLGGGSEH